jgi:predicted regulator of Ras-like GTPase activity (Roadblock/LC7/MglB family)
VETDSAPAARRDTKESAFTAILRQLAARMPGFQAAVFFDHEGETIDYHSSLDPFETRLTAAHIGIVMVRAITRFRDFSLGEVRFIEINAEHRDYVSIALGENLFFLVVVAAGNITSRTWGILFETTRMLREEAGLSL